MRLLFVHSLLAAVVIVRASVIVSGPHIQQPYGVVTSATNYDSDVISIPPPLPNPLAPTLPSSGVQLEAEGDCGDAFSTDGLLSGADDVQAINHDQSNICDVKAPAPGAVPVFLSNSALAASDRESETTLLTTAQTNFHNTSTVDPVALDSSNGNKDIADSPAGVNEDQDTNGASGLSYAMSGVGALIAGAFLVNRMGLRWW